MNMTRDRVQSIAWALTVVAAFGLLMGLTFRVNAVKSQVRLTERRIVSLRQEKSFLETEFQTRSNQQQLAALNEVEFGFTAPGARQYIEGERQLAAFGKPIGPGAPSPIRMASAAPVADKGSFPEVFSPLAGQALAAEPKTRLLAKRTDKVALADGEVPLEAPEPQPQ